MHPSKSEGRPSEDNHLNRQSSDGYLIHRVYDKRVLGYTPHKAGRYENRVILLPEAAARYVIVELNPMITPEAMERLTEREEFEAVQELGQLRFGAFLFQLSIARRVIEEQLLDNNKVLDKRSYRGKERLPFAENGGPWHRLPTQFYWQNAAGLYLSANMLRSQSLDEHVNSLVRPSSVMMRPRICHLKEKELANYTTLVSQLHP